jgi:bifunctional NMN adenylyltransferase/nudix hydrolase
MSKRVKIIDLAVFMGRFQIFHLGHLGVVHRALEKADNLLIIIGSANMPRGHRNPFSTIERIKMIESSLCSDELDRVHFAVVEDTAYDDTGWITSVQRVVDETVNKIYNQRENEINFPKISLIGHSKDHTSYYLKLFPQWGDNIEVPDTTGLSSTPMRQAYFSNIGDLWLKDADGHNVGDKDCQKLIPTGVKEFLTKFMKTEGYKYIVEEYEHITDYHRQWINSPYPPTFVTVDCLVEQSGHILLIKRRAVPGRGLYALPGGFINKDEWIIDAAMRELREETAIKLPEPVLRGSIVNQCVFDSPNRSARGRTITHAFHIKLPNEVNLVRVKGGDDAEKAKWFPIHKVRRDMMFEDHMDIIKYFINS